MQVLPRTLCTEVYIRALQGEGASRHYPACFGGSILAWEGWAKHPHIRLAMPVRGIWARRGQASGNTELQVLGQHQNMSASCSKKDQERSDMVLTCRYLCKNRNSRKLAPSGSAPCLSGSSTLHLPAECTCEWNARPHTPKPCSPPGPLQEQVRVKSDVNSQLHKVWVCAGIKRFMPIAAEPVDSDANTVPFALVLRP